MKEKTDEELAGQILQGLNERQMEAVLAPARGVLQVVAGPGTGKTKVLVSRVARLLLHEKIRPEEIIVTTFTKKAAIEMIERLGQLLRDTTIDLGKLMIGTFHSICFKVIRKYGTIIGIGGYNVAGENDSDQILRQVLSKISEQGELTLAGIKDVQEYKMQPDDSESRWNCKKVSKRISSLKASGMHPSDIAVQKNSFLRVVFTKYQEALHLNRLLDYDDCLLYCYKLLCAKPVLNFVRHVLVDEFQDTNEIQLKLMYKFAEGHPTNRQFQHNVTIVGDPDQSIYGFRDAQSVNFTKMKQHYNSLSENDEVRSVVLQENYRSTSDILTISEQIMRQDVGRGLKDLRSQKNLSFQPIYGKLNSAEQEAQWISIQINILISLPNNLFNYDDFSILVRSSFQTRCIEAELAKKKIPYVIHKGRAFWQRKEVVAILDYLRVVANKNDRIAYLRTLNLPKRGIGEKTLAAIENEVDKESENSEKSVFEVLSNIASGYSKVPLTSRNKVSLQKYISIISSCHLLLQQLERNCIDSDILNAVLIQIFEKVYISTGLRDVLQNDNNTELNVKEVQKQLLQFKPSNEVIPDYIGQASGDTEDDTRNFLELFIQSLNLDDHITSDDGSIGKVRISTIHGAKGLEWPIVFIPGLSDGVLPARFAIDEGKKSSIDEERRCFYVATTRAKTLLFLSSYVEDSDAGKWGRPPIQKISRFISHLDTRKSFDSKLSLFRDMRKLEMLYITLEMSHKFDILAFKKLESSLDYVDDVFEASSCKNLKTYAPSPSNGDLFLGFKSAKDQAKVKKEATFSSNLMPSQLHNRRQKKLCKTSLCEASKRFLTSIRASSLSARMTDKKEPLKAPLTEIRKNVGKKAPAYIPVRKVPKHILKLRKQQLNDKK